MKFFFGIRVWKTAVAAVAAVYLAGGIGLSHSLSAGLLAVLGVEVTRKRGIVSATQRFLASIVGLLIGAFLFYLFGFENWVIGLFILVAYPILAKVKLKDGIITSSVVVLHVFTEGRIHVDMLLNEIALLVIGLGCATIVNMVYMPGADEKLGELRARTERQFSSIFLAIAEHLRDPHILWDGKEYSDAVDAVEQGISLAAQADENALFRHEHYWQEYFHMRRSQLESIGRMMGLVAQIYDKLPQAVLTAQVFEELSEDVKADAYTGRAEADLKELEAAFQAMDLPATREEFELRSAILQLCVELRTYLETAKREKKRREPLKSA
ncbi:aromatic acid exporter family protein [Xylanibacillus composti]|uniref:Putative aromatic acid exporter C-terminal domain-containing protein n=1 Tax=Xylanibacillus composti TaxID=1572762 RepID=A0A8J4H145_9BACL|nr:aromatic acid exporter family protein [Xylanibacillus composti]MDT9725573.1 aromatic acid exporter family protein [Xylanibacillus composti]GIQ67666.1 hypothetical protein XYCOK13_04900 [Xylanibacillus composti]